MRKRTISFTILAGALVYGANLVLVAIAAFPFTWLWNWTLVPLFHAPAIGYSRALGLLLIWAILGFIRDGLRLGLKFRDPL